MRSVQAFAVAMLLTFVSSEGVKAQAKPPHILFVVADDLG